MSVNRAAALPPPAGMRAMLAVPSATCATYTYAASAVGGLT